MHSKNNVIITPVKNNISLYKITNKNGVEAHLTNYGATLLSLYVPTTALKYGEAPISNALIYSSIEWNPKTTSILPFLVGT